MNEAICDSLSCSIVRHTESGYFLHQYLCSHELYREGGGGEAVNEGRRKKEKKETNISSVDILVMPILTQCSLPSAITACCTRVKKNYLLCMKVAKNIFFFTKYFPCLLSGRRCVQMISSTA